MKRILIVDDDTAIREGLDKVLRAEGYETVLAADASEALAQFGDREVDLLLLDLNLPTKSGWDLFESFTDVNPLLPIIIITGRPDQCFLATGAGVGALLEKPVDVDFLLQSIRELLEESDGTRLHRLLGNNEALRYAAPTNARSRKTKINEPHAYEATK